MIIARFLCKQSGPFRGIFSKIRSAIIIIIIVVVVVVVVVIIIIIILTKIKFNFKRTIDNI